MFIALYITIMHKFLEGQITCTLYYATLQHSVMGMIHHCHNLVDYPPFSYSYREEFESKHRHWGTILTSNARYTYMFIIMIIQTHNDMRAHVQNTHAHIVIHTHQSPLPQCSPQANFKA